MALLCVTWQFAGRSALAQEQLPRIVNRCGSDVEPGGMNLASAVAAGGRITFACGGQATIRITRQHSVTQFVEIDGAGQITLDGNNATPFLLASTPDVVVRLVNLTVRRMASTNQSGVIGAASAVRIAIVNSSILESQLPIAILNGDVTVENSTFERNSNAVISAPNVTLNRARLRFNDAMPVFSRSGQVDIVDSEFEGNTSGSVFRGCNHARIVRTSFTNNSSKDTGQGTGGGAFSTACATDVENSTFTGNTSKSNGGAIRIRDTAARVRIRGSRFNGNIAVAGGGAIAVEPSAPPHAVVLQHTIFKGNSAQVGGALFFEDSTAGVPLNTTLQGGAVTFSGNTATDRGGAIAGGNATLDLSRSVFVRNAAQSGAAVWIDTPADRPSSFANSLFVLNKAPSGTFNGRAAHFINSTILGSDGPGLVLLPPVAVGGPAQVLRLSNSIIENNSGGNCRADAASIVDDGGNLQFPGTTCGGRIPVAAALLDTFYAPLVGGPARAQGRDDVCRGPKVQGHDLYGKRRPQADHCSIGAVEGDVEQLILGLQAGKALRGKSDNCRRDSASRSARDCDDRRTDRRTTECLAADLTTAPRVSSSNPSRTTRDGFPSAAEVLPPLFEAGIDFSVTKAEITDFLNNSRFTPYPAIASVLLTLTQARPLRCRVFLDVIVFNYENAPGAKSPRKVADVNLKLLRASIVEGYNNRYGTAHLAFENLLQ